MSKHTPGPWFIGSWDRSCGVTVVSEYLGSRRFVVALAIPGCPNEDAMRANARLIAAAPDLLAACRLLADYFAGHDPDDIPKECGSGVRDALIAARAAIAKAEGGVA